MTRIRKYRAFENNFRNKPKSKPVIKPKIQKLNIDGFEVLVGKNAISNDYLSIELSKDNDIWMHASGVPGSHVVISIEDEEPSEETIRKVAEIAAKNSKSNGDFTKVVITTSKYVTKKEGMNDGQVLVDYKNSYFMNV